MKTNQPATAVPPIYHWIGKSGQTYPYLVFPYGTAIWDLPGVYVICDELSPQQIVPVEIGEAESLSNDLMYYDMAQYDDMGSRCRPTPAYVHVRIELDAAARKAEVEDLKALYQQAYLAA